MWLHGLAHIHQGSRALGLRHPVCQLLPASWGVAMPMRPPKQPETRLPHFMHQSAPVTPAALAALEEFTYIFRLALFTGSECDFQAAAYNMRQSAPLHVST